MNRIKQVIDFASSVALIVISLVLGYSAWQGERNRVVRPESPQGPSAPTSRIVIGSSFPRIPGIDPARNETTLLLFLHTRCVACIQSIPDFALISRALQSGKSNGQAFGVFGGEPAEELKEFESLGLRLPMISVENLSNFGVAATPTIVLLDRAGTVQDFWIGRLSEAARHKLISRL